MNKAAELISKQMLKGFPVKVHLDCGCEADVDLKAEGRGKELCWKGSKNGISVTVTQIAKRESAVFFIDLESDKGLDEIGVTMPVKLDAAKKITAIHRDGGGSCWQMPYWPKPGDALNESTQHLLLKTDSGNAAVICFVGDVFRTMLEDHRLTIGAQTTGFREYHGPFLAASISDDPIKAMEEAYGFARECGALKVCLRKERVFPEMFEKFGWCSWNAFYQQPTSSKIFEKLDEFKEKNIPVNWVIIDDGWSPTREYRLLDFEEDREKFPEGLGECIRRMKEEYGVKQVGVWHTLHAYWNGIDPNTEFGKRHADCLIESVAFPGRTIPINEVKKQFGFWDEWHSYLEKCGVDFVKVDNQMCGDTYRQIDSTVCGVRTAYQAIERSIYKHFNGIVINCMGMDMENVQQRPKTAISRNSDDFYPDRENGFAKHLIQNVYNAVWHSQVYYCDYDMWWSGKADPVKSGLLRSISGGPVYISDAIGESSLEGILPVAGSDGDICRLDNAGMPTTDCIYRNCAEEGRIQKVFNTKGDSFALALFNISRKPLTESFSMNVIPGFPARRKMVAYEYFTKKFIPVTSSSKLKVTLGEDEVRSYSIYPVRKDRNGEYIMLGDRSRYIGIGCRTFEKTYLAGLI